MLPASRLGPSGLLTPGWDRTEKGTGGATANCAGFKISPVAVLPGARYSSDCRSCQGVKQERLDWLADNPFYTKRLRAEYGGEHRHRMLGAG